MGKIAKLSKIPARQSDSKTVVEEPGNQFYGIHLESAAFLFHMSATT